MKYCPRCGAKVIEHSAGKYVCSKCGVEHYINPKAATAIYILDNQGNLYLALRGREPHKGKLDCLGGFADIGENFEQAIMRELKEEANIDADDITQPVYLASAYDDYPWQNGVEPVGSVYFMAYLKPGVDLIAADDVESIVKVKLKDVNPANFAWQGMYSTYKELIKVIST